MHSLISSFCLLALILTSNAAFANCDEQTKQELKSVKSAGWKVDDDGKRESLALSAADCLGLPDTELRDELAFEGLSAWMRSEKLNDATLTALRVKMLNAVQAPAAEESSFLRPFAILTLAELVRTDRKKPYLSAQERIDIVNAGSHYLINLRDYRGFDAKDGWRHGIAHSADLMLQLAVNPAIEKPQHETMLAAIASQIAPPTHFYQYGEGVRLMTAVFYLARTPSFNKRDWDLWFNKLMDNSIQPGPYTQARLAQRHNVSAFLLPLYFSVRESTDPAIKENLLPALREALRKVN
ncbi:MAG: DUF2785 domain-containing protein [Burkholderiales bacterium]|nr:DUF2785 domain-containing protein [Burkholderiales bacterium]